MMMMFICTETLVTHGQQMTLTDALSGTAIGPIHTLTGQRKQDGMRVCAFNYCRIIMMLALRVARGLCRGMV
jgi:hypothetical protein